jgi:hypothetical protein
VKSHKTYTLARPTHISTLYVLQSLIQCCTRYRRALFRCVSCEEPAVGEDCDGACGMLARAGVWGPWWKDCVVKEEKGQESPKSGSRAISSYFVATCLLWSDLGSSAASKQP